MNTDFWFWGFLHGVRGEFPDDVSGAAHEQLRWDPQRLPKRRRGIHLAHRAKTPKPKIKYSYILCAAGSK